MLGTRREEATVRVCVRREVFRKPFDSFEWVVAGSSGVVGVPATLHRMRQVVLNPETRRKVVL
jgi:hypothetical protein